ncbi:hypothetical protein EDB81DRAFT_48842 [Dactylonectria macrodidyma]|uniref:Uncharacterized protein n=1 Tax=Dactylonectria macrodidyma TaxID=307937 RepID=A0A9P9JRX3_9HYPO|nr:hypothetical protein EDB81DRAFT_48842 [Dactylonectria macrodidyma]
MRFSSAVLLLIRQMLKWLICLVLVWNCAYALCIFLKATSSASGVPTQTGPADLLHRSVSSSSNFRLTRNFQRLVQRTFDNWPTT